jgi:Skp family chaperone for outer membrane proteins
VRKLILTATGIICLAGGSYFLSATRGAPSKEAAEDVPHRVGLIDMGYVFEHYEKVKYLSEEMNIELKDTQRKLEDKAKRGRDMQEQIKAYNEGSTEYTALENKMVKLAAELETDNKMFKNEINKKRAKMVHQVYLEVYDAVEKFCNHHKFTVVIRFSRADLSSNDPNRVNQLMNQIVVYHRTRDDLTEPVVKYLNGRLPAATGDAKPISDTKAPKKDKKVTPAVRETPADR